MKLSGTMKVIIAVMAVAVVLVGCGASQYNGIIRQDEQVSTTWSKVQSSYQRRADLIPNLVSTVKGYAKHEENTFKEEVEARAKATQITVDPSRLTPEKLREYRNAQGELGAALGKLLAVQENYPDLKANEQFSELQAQLEGTENRINEARNRYNDAVQNYNLSVRKFPINILAGMFGFQPKTKFEAEVGSDKAPKVEF